MNSRSRPEKPSIQGRILVLTTGLARLRHFYSVLDELDRRRCYTVIASDDAHRTRAPERYLGQKRMMDVVLHPHHDLDAHPGFAALCRLRDVVSYRFFAEKVGSWRLSQRVDGHADLALVELSRRRFPEFDSLRGWMRKLERATPAVRVATRFVAAQRPDAVLVTPLLHPLNHHQVEYTKAAIQLGIPVVYGINSWDNVTTKGDLFVMPDRTYVWNAFQAEEMVRYLEVPAESIRTIGAWRMDPFLALSPSDSRDALLRARGLDPARRTLVYVCSSQLAGDDEDAFLASWLAVVAAQFAEPDRPNLILRPHPRRPLDLQSIRRRWGPTASVSVQTQLMDEQDLYDELSVADAAVGVNTSAILQAIALGKPVFLPRCAAVAQMHEGLPHAEFLTRPEDGLVKLGADLESHARELSALLRGGGAHEHQHLERLSGEVIGCGDGSATRRFVARLLEDARQLKSERMAGARAADRPRAGWARVFRHLRAWDGRGLDGRPISNRSRALASVLLTRAVEAADAHDPVWRLTLFAEGEASSDAGERVLQACRAAAPGSRLVRILPRLARHWPHLRSLAEAMAAIMLKDAGSRDQYDFIRARWMSWYPRKAGLETSGGAATDRSGAEEAALDKATPPG